MLRAFLRIFLAFPNFHGLDYFCRKFLFRKKGGGLPKRVLLPAGRKRRSVAPASDFRSFTPWQIAGALFLCATCAMKQLLKRFEKYSKGWGVSRMSICPSTTPPGNHGTLFPQHGRVRSPYARLCQHKHGRFHQVNDFTYQRQTTCLRCAWLFVLYRGFGFVEYFDEKDAQNAVREFDRFLLDGNEISVIIAQDRRKSVSHELGIGRALLFCCCYPVEVRGLRGQAPYSTSRTCNLVFVSLCDACEFSCSPTRCGGSWLSVRMGMSSCRPAPVLPSHMFPQ